MNILFKYALVLGLSMSFVVLVGCTFRKRSLILAGMIFSSISASPVISFTRGAAGAIYSSDLVALTLLLCMMFPSTKTLFCGFKPDWYKWFFRLMMLSFVSVILVAPVFSEQIGKTGLEAHVTSPIPGIPLVILMMGFRLIRLTLFYVYFFYAAHMLMDEETKRVVYKLIIVAIFVLAICQILDFFGVANLGLVLKDVSHQRAHILGHVRGAAGRFYIMGIFLALVFFRRVFSAPLCFVILAVMGLALILSGSRGPFVGLLVAMLVVGVRSKFLGKFLGVILLVLLPLGFSVLTKANIDVGFIKMRRFEMMVQDPSSNPRWIIWQQIVPYIGTHPHIWFSGVGLSNFRYALVGEYMAEHAHNDFLTCITEVGLLGLVLFCMYLYCLHRDIRLRVKYTTGQSQWEAVCLLAIFMAYLVSSLFEGTFYFSGGMIPTQRILAILFGTTTAQWLQEYQMEESWDEEYFDEEVFAYQY